MQWRLEINYESSEVRSADELGALLRTAAAQRAVSLTLERVLVRPPATWEKIVYPLLGLVVPQDEPRGTIQISISADRALMVFLKDDADDGVVAAAPNQELRGEVEFTTAAGEKFWEPASQCISRDDALAALTDFFHSGKRPQRVKWMHTRARNAVAPDEKA